MGARRMTEIPISRDQLEAYRYELARDHGAVVWEHGHTRILLVRVPKDAPDIVNDVEAAVEAISPGDVDNIDSAILMGDRVDHVVPVQPFRDLMADRVAFDKAQCRAIRQDLGGGGGGKGTGLGTTIGRQGDDGFGSGHAWCYRAFRARGDARRNLRLAVFAPVDRLAELDDGALDTMAKMLGPDAEAGRFVDISCVYLVSRGDDVRMRADEFLEQVLGRWQSAAFLAREAEERQRIQRIKASERRNLLKDLETRHGLRRQTAGAALGAGLTGSQGALYGLAGSAAGGLGAQAGFSPGAAAQEGPPGSRVGHETVRPTHLSRAERDPDWEREARDIDRIIGGEARSRAAAAPILGNVDRTAAKGASQQPGMRYVDPEAEERARRFAAQPGYEPAMLGGEAATRGITPSGHMPGAERDAGSVVARAQDMEASRLPPRPLAQADTTVVTRGAHQATAGVAGQATSTMLPSPGRARLLERLEEAGYDLLENPNVPGHHVEVAAERPEGFPERLIAILPMRLDAGLADSFVATANALDADLGLVVCDEADADAQDRLLATKVKWVPSRDLGHLRL